MAGDRYEKTRVVERQALLVMKATVRQFLRLGVRGAACCAPTWRIRRGCRLLSADEVAAAILLPAGFVVLVAEGLFFAEADRADAIGGDAQRNEVLLDGAGATIAEREVVFGGTTLVAVAFDGHAKLRVVAQEVGGLGECFASVRANVGFVEVEIGVTDFLVEERIPVRLGRLFDRRRRNGDVDARGGVCGTAGAISGNGISRGIGRRPGGGAFRVYGAYARSNGELRRVGGGPAQRRRFTPVDGSRIARKRHGRLRGRRCGSGSRRRRCRNGFLFAATCENGGQQTCHQQSAVQRTRDHSHSYPPQS